MSRLPSAESDQPREKILLEVEAVPGQAAPQPAALQSRLACPGLSLDPSYEPVPSQTEDGRATYVYRGEITTAASDALKRSPGVVNVWSDAPVEPFQGGFGA